MSWTKLHTDEWLYGSIRKYGPEIRALWPDLQSLAADSILTGNICITPTVGYERNQLSKMLNYDVNLLDTALNIFIKEKYIKIDENGVICIVDWNVYQSEYQRLSKYKKCTNKYTKKGTKKDTPKDITKIPVSVSVSVSESNSLFDSECISSKSEEGVGEVKPVKDKAVTQIVYAFDSQEFKVAYGEWIQYRKELKKPLTPSTIEKQMKRLKKLGEKRAIAAIEFSIEKGWEGIFEDSKYVEQELRAEKAKNVFPENHVLEAMRLDQERQRLGLNDNQKLM